MGQRGSSRGPPRAIDRDDPHATGMRLTGPDGALTLTLAGYQFPHLATVEHDSNWLNVHVRVRHPRGEWAAQDASLLTYEAASLAGWLEAVASGREPDAECSFLEPNLRFEVRADEAGGRTLRVYFELELRPAWAPYDGAPEDDLFIDVPVERAQLTTAAASLRRQLAGCPQRTGL
jgi:hypothetical protein